MDKAVVDLPFVYRADCVARGKRLSREWDVRDVGSFAIPVLANDEARVAFEVVRNDAFEEHVRESNKPRRENGGDRLRKLQGLPQRKAKVITGPEVVTMRSWGGRLYRSIGATRGVTFDPARFAEEAAKPTASFGLFQDEKALWPADMPVLSVMKDHGYERDRTLTVPTLSNVLAKVASDAGNPYAPAAVFGRPGGSQAARVKSDDRVTRLTEAATRYAEALAFVDGTTWGTEGVHEPFYAVEVGRKKESVRLVVRTGDYRTHDMSPFRADRLDEARAYAIATAERLRYALRETGDVLRVLDPRAVRRDDATMLAECMLSGLDGNDHFAQESWPRALREAYGELVRLDGKKDFGKEPLYAHEWEWTNAVMGAATSAYDEAKRTDNVDARSLAARLETAVSRWVDTERDRHPDLVEQADEGEALAFGF